MRGAWAWYGSRWGFRGRRRKRLDIWRVIFGARTNQERVSGCAKKKRTEREMGEMEEIIYMEYTPEYQSGKNRHRMPPATRTEASIRVKW